jgi:phosphatidylserine decarboxylase
MTIRSVLVRIFQQEDLNFLLTNRIKLEEAKKTRFKSLHECFTRELKDGLRPIDREPTVLVSPCDAIVGGSKSYSAKTNAHSYRPSCKHLGISLS